MKKSKVNGLIVDDSRTPFKDCSVIDQCSDVEPTPPGPEPVATLAFEPNTAQVVVGGTATVSIIYTDAQGNRTPLNPASLENLASDNANASIDEGAGNTLTVTGVEAGTTLFRATYNGLDADLNVTITAAP